MPNLIEGANGVNSSREVYTAIRNANRLIRKVNASGGRESWNESSEAWLWIKLKIIELLECLGFEILLVLRQVLFGLSVLFGWILVLGIVILWLGGFK